MTNNYQKQALVWDWDAFDNSPEYAHWCNLARPYGQNVLIPMCAHGQSGAYMAQEGFNVTAFDITPEMIEAGRERYGTVEGLTLTVADMLALDLAKKDFHFVFIGGNGDLHLLPSLEDVGKAFVSIYKHMRPGACLFLELTLPWKESFNHPKRIFHPRVPNYTDKKIWKENQSAYDAHSQRQRISQKVYIEDARGLDSFTQEVALQYWERDAVIALLSQCGFTIKNEYSDKDKTPWTPESNTWIVESII